MSKLDEAIKAFRPDFSIPVIDTLPQVIAIQSMGIDDYREILRAAKAWQKMQSEIKGDPEKLSSNYGYPIENAYFAALSQYNGKDGDDAG